MRTDFGSGFHVAPGRAVDAAAYDQYVGRWSRLFVPPVLGAARIGPGQRVLDVSTGTGEAALAALPVVGASGFVTGVDISPAMLAGARVRLNDPAFGPVAADGQALPFRDASFDAVICQLGLQFFPNPALGLAEFRRVLRAGGGFAVCVISKAERAPMWGILGDVLGRFRPDQRPVLNLSFALDDPVLLEALLAGAGFTGVAVRAERREDRIGSFEEYWAPIEHGVGSMPQVYTALSAGDRRLVREEVRSRLARFESGGRLTMGVEMLIGSGRG